MFLKKSIRYFLEAAAPVLPFSCWQKWAAQPLFLPFWHSVSDEPQPHIRHLYRVRGEQEFRADLDFLLRHFEPVGLAEIRQKTLGGEPFARPSMHLTFDDGLRECHDIIQPILLEKGIPATFFLNADFVENRGLMFRNQASLLVESGAKLPGNPLAVRYSEKAILQKWAEAAGVDFLTFLKEKQPYLTHFQIETMRKRGFTFGGHSLDHPFFGRISTAEQLRQAAESIRFVEKMGWLDWPVFAFPFSDDGVGRSFFQKMEADFGQPVLTFGTAGLKIDDVPTNLQRFPMETSSGCGPAAVAAESAWFLLKKMAGRHRVIRPD